MLAHVLIFVLPGAIAFGGLAWVWRNKLQRRRVHFLLALIFCAVTWFSSMLFGIFLFLDVLHAGPLGRTANAGFIWSFLPALLAYGLLRKRKQEPHSDIGKEREPRE